MPAVAAILLAAGASRRFGERNKLLLKINGQPLVRRAARAILAVPQIQPLIVVTGHQPTHIHQVLAGLPATFIHNPAHRSGMASSLRAGLRALPPQAAAALICLADMPHLEPSHIRAALSGRPSHSGPPALLPRRLFPRALSLRGDTGARNLLRAPGPPLPDIDTPQQWHALGESNPSFQVENLAS